MDNVKSEESQCIEIIDKNGSFGQNSAVSPEFFASPLKSAKCEICGADFNLAARATVMVCSDACRHERRLRYHRTYYRRMRDGRAKLLALFGTYPTEEEIFDFLKPRKDDQ